YLHERQDGQTPLSQAANAGDVELTRLLLQSGADPNFPDEDGAVPLFFATRHEVTRTLLEAGARIEFHPYWGSALHLAAADPDTTRLRLLLSAPGAQNALIWFDDMGWSPLHWAASQGRVEAIRLLLAAGTPADLRCPGGRTALALAWREGHGDAIAALLEGGADPELSLPEEF
ncbi:MAG: ankyrin repeat domain-containing protein, partial [Candidatus Eremiobacterota bacterium]